MATNMNIKLTLGLMTNGLTNELLYLDICDVMEINGGQTYHSECNAFIFMFQQLQSLGQ
jgi:hypothetical protein